MSWSRWGMLPPPPPLPHSVRNRNPNARNTKRMLTSAMRRSLKTDDLKNYNFSDDEEEDLKDRWSELIHHVQTQTFWFCVQILVVLMPSAVLTEYHFIIWRYMKKQGRVPVLHLYMRSKPLFYMPFVFNEILLEFGISSGNLKVWFNEILCYMLYQFIFFKC